MGLYLPFQQAGGSREHQSLGARGVQRGYSWVQHQLLQPRAGEGQCDAKEDGGGVSALQCAGHKGGAPLEARAARLHELHGQGVVLQGKKEGVKGSSFWKKEVP